MDRSRSSGVTVSGRSDNADGVSTLKTDMATVTLRRGEDKRIRSGHLWIFSNEIDTVEGNVSPGDAVVVRESTGHLLGTG